MPSFHGFFDSSCSLDISPSGIPINGNDGSGIPVLLNSSSSSSSSSSSQYPTNYLGSFPSENMDEHAVYCADLIYYSYLYKDHVVNRIN